MDLDSNSRDPKLADSTPKSSYSQPRGAKTVSLKELAVVQADLEQEQQLEECMSANLVANMFCPEAVVVQDSEDSPQHARWLKLKEMADKSLDVAECSKFLKEMELLGSDNEGGPDFDDNALAWQEELAAAGRNIYGDLMQCAEEEQEVKLQWGQTEKQLKKEKVKWGPTQRVDRPRRHAEDGKTVLQRAEELVKYKNLEVAFKGNTGNSFALLDNDYLHTVAKQIDLSLGHDQPTALENVCLIKGAEILAVTSFEENNPDVLLPSNLDVDVNIENFPPLKRVDGSVVCSPIKDMVPDSTKVSWSKLVGLSKEQNNSKNVSHDRSLLEC